jgi:hypothetical protein
MPYGSTNDPVVERIEVYPRQRVMSLGGEQQLIVTAHYTDGRREDVTRSALYEPNDKDMARAEDNGLVRLYRQPGDVAVMIRYQAKVDVFRATIPLGLALGIGAGYMIAMWTAVVGVLFLPANGTQIAAAEADTTGTTSLGKRVVDHSFQLPLQIAWIVTALVGIAIVWIFFGGHTPAPPAPTPTP